MTPIVLICAVLAFSDGDSGRCITEDGERHRVRLAGVDAGEVAPFTRCRQQPDIWACTTGRPLAAPAAQRARQLGAMGARCTVTSTDRYRRNVAVCTVSGEDIAATLVREGLAIDDPSYRPSYAREQEEARERGKGVWK